MFFTSVRIEVETEDVKLESGAPAGGVRVASFKEVNVPGKIIKPASRIQVKNEEARLCRRGIVSTARSIWT